MKKLFTERFGGLAPRVKEELDDASATGLLSIIQARISENWFGAAFPEECEDGGLNAGCSVSKLKGALAAYNLIWPEDWQKVGQIPEYGQIFDLTEFSYEHIALPEPYFFHSYWRHDHFNYDQEKGRSHLVADINRVFERHGIAYELVGGEVTRMAPSGLHQALADTVFKTGDSELDRLLENAREKFLNRSLDIRKEALEKLWDAWERLKTVEPGSDKKVMAKAILDKATTEPILRERLEIEAKELTFIGNNLMIRHTEVGKPPIPESAQMDYLFHRMFAMIRLLLRSSGRGG